MIQVRSPTSALFNWSPVPIESVRGELKGYKIRTWTEKEDEEKFREINIKGNKTHALVNKFIPFSKNFVKILLYNGR